MMPVLFLLMAPSPNNALTANIVMFALIFAIFYFLMIVPQRRQRRQHEARLNALRRGDEVVTAGGLVGEIVQIKQTLKDGQPVSTPDDRITIRTGEARVVVERGRIARVLPKSGATEPAS